MRMLGTDSHDWKSVLFILFGQLSASLLFQQQRFAGFERQHGHARRGAGFQRLRADTGNVEPHVVIGFGDLDGHRAAVLARELAAAREALVRAFKTLDGQHHAVFDHDGLADFQPRRLPGDAKTKVHVGLLLRGKLRAQLKTGPRA